MQKEQVINILLDSYYYTQEDLRFNTKYNFLFSKDQLGDFLTIKESLLDEGYERLCKLPLVTFNSKYCFYTKGLYIVKNEHEYLTTVIEDYKQNDTLLYVRNFKEILMSRAFSEIEGTLAIENIPTTRKKIQDIFNKSVLTDKNDIIVRNMIYAMSYIIEEKPVFNKTNLNHLYKLLSDGCLDDEDMLMPNSFYRHDDVYVGGFSGAPVNKIEEMMDSLFAFANNPKYQSEYEALMPHICHYYILYVHPYFDYNGRTARMVSFWLSYLLDSSSSQYFISEAINEYKSEYYKAIKNTRIMNNDLTYFLGFIFESSIKFCLLYKNMEAIRKALSVEGDFLSSTETMYIKKILIHNSNDFFNYKMFLEYINSTISKQGALKMLDKLTEYKLLIKSKNKKKENIYKFNQDFITYKYKK